MHNEMGILAALAGTVAAIAWKAGLALGLTAAMTNCTMSVSFSPLDVVDQRQQWDDRKEQKR